MNWVSGDPTGRLPPFVSRLLSCSRWMRLAARFVFSILVFLLVLEIALRLVGFEHHLYIAQVKHRQSTAILAEFKQDPSLIWSPKPGNGPFNRLGFIGPELPTARSPGTVRIACLGDSCTLAGSPPYPEILGSLLTERGYSGIEVMNWGVAGYSSFQGLLRLEREVIAYHPDIYTIYFGWNDHWIRAGLPDDLAAARLSPLRMTLEETRVAQAATLFSESLLRRSRRAGTQFRVPLPAYRENLRQMVRLVREAGENVLLITAPGCLIDDRPIVRHLEGLESLGYSNAAAVHAAYVEATRQVAVETQAALFDAARFFDEEIPGCDYFIPHQDPVHLTDAGLRIFAEQLAERLIHTGWLD